MVAIGLQALDSVDQNLFRYERSVLESAEIWRVLTGHFIHLGWSHLLLNMSVFLIFWYLFQDLFSNRVWVFTILFCALGISVFFLFFDTVLQDYVGFSGVLHGLFFIAAIITVDSYRKTQTTPFPWESGILLIAILLKITYEQIAGPVELTQKASGGDVIVNAHLFGVIMGLILFIPFRKKTSA